ncbi:hypothetical protein [Saccharopolyspora sp. NPDC002376]
MNLLVDGQRASAIDGLHLGYVEKLAGHPHPVGCCDCGGPAPQVSALTTITRHQDAGPGMGVSAWRRCADCVELRRHGIGALARDALSVHGLGPAENAPLSAVRPALQRYGLPWWHLQDLPREEFSAPVERWDFPAAAQWAARFRDRVRRELAFGGGAR